MKRPWAVLLIVCLCGGCRSSQPATNPFLRTTVPPPATTPGVIATPGQPYAAGISPPVVTTPAVPAAPPVITTPVPVTPAPAPAPAVAPPVVPQGDEFHPPGGSYLYHQSSNQTQPTAAQPAANQLAVAHGAAGGVSTVAFTQPTSAAPTGAVQQAAYVQNPYVQSTATLQAPAAQTPAGMNRGDPPESTTSVSLGAAQPQNTIRIVGPSSPGTTLSAPVAAPTATAQLSAAPVSAPAGTSQNPVMRMTVGAAQPAVRSTVTTNTAASPANVTFSGSAPGQTTAHFVTQPAASPKVVQTAFQPAAGSADADYAHTADYSILRGRLEYLQSSRQWKLRYIPIDGQTDDFGGSVVLNDSPALASFQSGDLVAVRGILAGGGGQAAGFSPRYTLTAIERTR